ncbi:MAG: ABC transporter ATP-binding protein [Spirochaetales bacterium]|jgi:oligopeptide/dipeptide ABC transporter ATP-binding protein|nr:ABC transporter ATP-binding protein [Spirochaetales bacterium]
MSTRNQNNIALDIRDLVVQYRTRKGIITPVDKVSLDVRRGECLGIAGESGCGKSTLAQALMRLLPTNSRITSGSILFDGEDLAGFTEKDYSDRIWGNRIIMIGQNPHDALNPVFKVGSQLIEILKTHRNNGAATGKQAKREYIDEITKILISMGISDIDRVLSAYPHQLSGGMKQRVLIAMAFFCDPTVLIADEPTTALDATIAAQVIAMFKELAVKSSVSMVYITHDIALLSEISQRIAVMYAGEVVELGDTERIVKAPVHPYTNALLKALPSASKDRLSTIPGRVPDFLEIGGGCRFYARCEHASERCMKNSPEFVEVESGHWVRCFTYSNQFSAEEI